MPDQGSHIGTLIKPHGYKGEMLLKGKAEIIKDLKKGIALFIDLSGQRIPFFIEEISNDNAGDRCIVKFEFIDEDIEAKRFVGCPVYSELTSSGSEKFTGIENNDYAGFTVIDQVSGDEFVVKEHIHNPGNPILLLEKEGREVMLPGEANYILSIDITGKQIIAAFPEGLEEE
ncbi:MAG: hypothetical protein WD578_08415 [Bacteroidales bacterium]